MRRFRFREGRNCWRVARAGRLSVMVDGESYFSAVRSSLIAAQRRIFILAWDIHRGANSANETLFFQGAD